VHEDLQLHFSKLAAAKERRHPSAAAHPQPVLLLDAEEEASVHNTAAQNATTAVVFDVLALMALFATGDHVMAVVEVRAAAAVLWLTWNMQIAAT
jgi:hypothetical protein